MARRLSNVDGAVTGGYTGGYIPGVVGHPAYYNMQGGLQPQQGRRKERGQDGDARTALLHIFIEEARRIPRAPVSPNSGF